MISDINIFINRELCYACGICVERCILDNLRLSVAPCRQRCPLQMNCQGYIRLIAQGKEEEAAAEMYRQTPFSGILGRICHRPCEAVCERANLDGPVHIRALKRYLADLYPHIAGRRPEAPLETGKQAVVIGSGPAGLTAAYELRNRGHKVVVYEAEAEVGGMLRYAIPSFRLPTGEVDRAIDLLERMGVVFKTGMALGRKLYLEELEREYDTVILACGGGEAVTLSVPGVEQDGVIGATDLLKQVKTGGRPELGSSVVVIGGGNAAVDAALTCRRLGVIDVKMVCLEEREEMTAFSSAIHEALDEGVVIENCWGPLRLSQGEEGSIEIELSKCLSLFDDQGRFNPTLADTCDLALNAEQVIIAVGQKPAFGYLPAELLDPISGYPAVHELTLQTPNRPKVFVCGDALRGPKTVVEAMATGREASISCDRLLRGEGLEWGRGLTAKPWIEDYIPDTSRAQERPRTVLKRRKLTTSEPLLETETTMTAAMAASEAERCLSCGRAAEVNQTCWYCLPCEIECPVQALEVRLPYLVR